MIEFFTSSTFRTVLSALNSGFLKTLQLFFITLIGALPLGLVISFGSMSRLAPFARPVHWFLRRQKREPGRIARALIVFRPIRLICRLVVWVIRGTPLVLQIIALFYVPGIQKWFNWPSGESGRMMAVCVAFIINYACYFSEIYRGGIQGVPKGQQEAGQVLGMTKAQIFRHITLLQMIKRIVPPHLQRDHHVGKGHLPGAGHRIAGGHLDGRVLYEGQLRHCRPGVAPVLHRCLLSDLQRHRHGAAGQA